MKTHDMPVVVEVDEEGFFIVSCPLYKRLSPLWENY
jgi:hypothetical protein